MNKAIISVINILVGIIVPAILATLLNFIPVKFSIPVWIVALVSALIGITVFMALSDKHEHVFDDYVGQRMGSIGDKALIYRVCSSCKYKVAIDMGTYEDMKVKLKELKEGK